MAVKIGFIGSGGIANAHMSALAGIADAEMKAFTDLLEDRAKAAANKYGGNAYTDCKAMLDNEELDAVYVCVPPYGHPGPELAAAECKLALFVEKPAAMNLREGQEIVAAVCKVEAVTPASLEIRAEETSVLVICRDG